MSVGTQVLGDPSVHHAEVRLDHVGLDVRDLDRQTAFYCDGFALRRSWHTEITAVSLTVVWLSSTDGWRLELFHRDGAAPADVRDVDTQHDVLGLGHVAFACPTADAVTVVHDRLLPLGARSLLAPTASAGPASTRAYVADPEGNLLELVHLGG